MTLEGIQRGRDDFVSPLLFRETFAAVRQVWPGHLALTIRFGVFEFDGSDERTLTESVELIRHWKDDGQCRHRLQCAPGQDPMVRASWALPAPYARWVESY